MPNIIQARRVYAQPKTSKRDANKRNKFYKRITVVKHNHGKGFTSGVVVFDSPDKVLEVSRRGLTA